MEGLKGNQKGFSMKAAVSPKNLVVLGRPQREVGTPQRELGDSWEELGANWQCLRAKYYGHEAIREGLGFPWPWTQLRRAQSQLESQLGESAGSASEPCGNGPEASWEVVSKLYRRRAT